MKKALLFIVLVLIVVGSMFYLAARMDTPPENNQGASCDMSLWAHVYHGRFPNAEGRLHILDPCVTVSGHHECAAGKGRGLARPAGPRSRIQLTVESGQFRKAAGLSGFGADMQQSRHPTRHSR